VKSRRTANRLSVGIIAVCLALFVVGCSDDPKSSAQKTGQKLTEQAFDQQQKAVPYPVDDLKDSQERRNLRERLLRQNDPERIGYVYFVQFGKFLGYWTIKGKVSSTQSQMTTDMLQVDTPDDGSRAKDSIVTAPGDDGSYGPNEPGVFFFTTEGAMIQVPEDAYVYSDQPIAVGSIPELNGEGKVAGAE